MTEGGRRGRVGGACAHYSFVKRPYGQVTFPNGSLGTIFTTYRNPQSSGFLYINLTPPN